MAEITFRDGGIAELDWLLGLFDEAIEWMVARGQPGQWGDKPLSQSERGRANAARMCETGGLRVCAVDGEEVAALIVDEHPPWVQPITEPELYIELLLVSRRHAGRRIGEALVERALTEARDAGIGVVRVDCWAGAPSLVAWYEACGFERAGTFTVQGDWVGQVFSLRL